MSKKDDKNGSTAKGVMLSLLVILAAIGIHTLFQMVRMAVV